MDVIAHRTQMGEIFPGRYAIHQEVVVKVPPPSTGRPPTDTDATQTINVVKYHDPRVYCNAEEFHLRLC